jgi:hypothetical protein
MSTFSATKLTYLGERRLARITTVGDDGTPHVTPVGMWSYNPEHESIDVTVRDFEHSRSIVTWPARPGPPLSSTTWPARTVGDLGGSKSAAAPKPSPNPKP